MDQLLFHSYNYGTALWYVLRGGCRIWDAKMVVGWFRPPSQMNLMPNDLELYNVKNDAWGLMTLAIVLVNLSVYRRSTSPAFKRATILATVFHHVTTGIGAYQHYKLDTHYNTSMAIGVWANIGLTLVGLAAAAVAPGSEEAVEVNKKLN